jgi:hypothetical protein
MPLVEGARLNYFQVLGNRVGFNRHFAAGGRREGELTTTD